jgi:hypothetical protein
VFEPKVLTDSRDCPHGYFMFTNCKTFDEVAEFVETFTNKHGEPTEGYVWQAREGFIHVWIRNDFVLRMTGEK